MEVSCFPSPTGSGPPSSVPDLSDLRCTETLGSGIPDSPEQGPRKVASVPGAPHTLIDIKLPVRAFTDWTLIRDDRVIQNLFKLEAHYLPSSPDYFKYIQTEITPSMRKIVADWMLQVCQELNCQPEVFCLAMNYMDRFLARCPVTKSRLQLVGSVCLLISSKFKQTCPIPGEDIIFFTDYSITPEEIKDWELLVLQELSWELSSVSPFDYLDQIIARLGLHPDLNLPELKRRTETILVLAVTEYQFAYLNPSLLACTALLTTFNFVSQVSGPVLTEDGRGLKEVKSRLLTITRAQNNDVEHCTELLLEILPSYLLHIPQSSTSCPSPPDISKACPSTPTSSSNSVSMTTTPESLMTNPQMSTLMTSPESQTTTSSSVSSSPTSGLHHGDFQTMTSSLKPDLTDSYSILVS